MSDLRQRRPISSPTATTTSTSTTGTSSTTKANDDDDVPLLKGTTMASSNSNNILIVHVYSIIWCIHYIIPYLDTLLYQSTQDVTFDYGKKHLKFIPALDHRPIDTTVLDAYILLPLIIYILYLYLIRYSDHIFTTIRNNHNYNIDIFVLRYVYIAHIIDTIVIRYIIRMPYVWDHEQWASLCNIMFITCYAYPLFLGTKTIGKQSSTTVPSIIMDVYYYYYWFQQYVSYLLGILYGAAAFWKLTTSFWYYSSTSCGSSLILETIITYFGSFIITVPRSSSSSSNHDESDIEDNEENTIITATTTTTTTTTIPPLAQFAVDAGPYLTLFVEASISIGMIYLALTTTTTTTTMTKQKNNTTRTMIRNYLILQTIIFHLIIYMLPVNAAGGFSLDCVTRFIVFFTPNEIYTTFILQSPHIYTKISRIRIWTICFIVWIRYKGTGYPLDFGFLYYCLLLDLYMMIMFPKKSTKITSIQSQPISKMSSPSSTIPLLTKILSNGILCIGLFYGVGLTILGLQQMGAPTMYSNLRSYYGGNHLLVRTGILGDDILYGSRLVQITYSTCDTLNQMLGYIDSVELEPEPLYTYQKALLRNASIPYIPIQNHNLPIQFLPMCISNPHSKKLLMEYYRKSNPIGQPVPFQFILPLNVVKRVIETAQQQSVSFVVKLADGGRSSELKQPPTLEIDVTEVIVLNERGECTVELYQGISFTNTLKNTTTISKDCNDHVLGPLVSRQDEGITFMNYVVSKLLLPYPQIVGESEEICMS